MKRKAQARAAGDGNTINEATVWRDRPDKRAGPVDTSKSLVVAQSLAFPPEDQAMSYFYHHWAPVDNAYARSYIQQVKNLGLTGNALPGLVAAIGMGGISSTRNDPQMMLLARKRYTKVLPVITANLQDPVLWTASSTLMAVLLSGLFEVRQFSVFNYWANGQIGCHMFFSCVSPIMGEAHTRCAGYSTTPWTRSAEK